jgi:hypothetical protein
VTIRVNDNSLYWIDKQTMSGTYELTASKEKNKLSDSCFWSMVTIDKNTYYINDHDRYHIYCYNTNNKQLITFEQTPSLKLVGCQNQLFSLTLPEKELLAINLSNNSKSKIKLNHVIDLTSNKNSLFILTHNGLYKYNGFDDPIQKISDLTGNQIICNETTLVLTIHKENKTCFIDLLTGETKEVAISFNSGVINEFGLLYSDLCNEGALMLYDNESEHHFKLNMQATDGIAYSKEEVYYYNLHDNECLEYLPVNGGRPEKIEIGD